MAQKVIKVYKAGQLAFGLNWSTLPGAAKQSAEVKKLVKERKAHRVSLVKTMSGKSVIGLSVGTPFKGSALAAAALFARLLNGGNGLFVYQFEDDSYALIGVMDGVPMPGFDRVAARTEIEQLATDFAALSTGVDLPVYGNVEISGANNPLSPAELVSQNRKGIKDAQLRSTQMPIGLVVGVVLVAVAVAGGAVFYKQWQEEIEKKREAERQIANPNAWYAEQITPILAHAGYPAHKVVSIFVDELDKLPLYHAGWKLDKASCVPGSCALTWTIESGGSFGSFKDHLLPYCQNVVYKPDLKTIECTLSFKMPESVQGLQATSLPAQAAYEFEQDDNNQRNAGLFPSVTREPALNIVTLPPSVRESDIAQVINMGTWTFNGAIIHADVLNQLPPNMTLETFNVGFVPGVFSLSAQGKYYVQK